METMDQEQAVRVWQRVRPTAEEPVEGILLDMWENASAWAQLARRTGGQQSAALRELSRQEQSLCAVLRGFCRVSGADRVDLPQTPPVQGSPGEILRLSYDRCRRILSGMETHHCPVFAHLRELEMEQCLRLLELIGKL